MMKQIFSGQGISAIVHSDNGSHYNSKEYEMLAKKHKKDLGV